MAPRRKKARSPNAIGVVVEGGIQCVCGKIFPKQCDINQHFRERCYLGPKQKIKCNFCDVMTKPKNMLGHVVRKHPKKLAQWKVIKRKLSAADNQLLKKLKELGHPGGKIHHRNGFLFHMNESLRLARYGFEQVDSSCLSTPIERRNAGWYTDKYLQETVRLGTRDIAAGRGGTWHFCHLVCAAYHLWDPQRIKDIMTSSIGMYQYKCINEGSYKTLEMVFRYLVEYGETFIFSATTLDQNRPPVGTEKKKTAVAAGFIKIASLFSDEEKKWWWDAYFIPNEKTSTASPNQYRVTSFDDLDKLSEFRFLSNIREVAEHKDLFAKGAEARLRWFAANQDSGTGMEIDTEEADSAADSDSSDEEETEAAAAESQESNDVPANPYQRIEQLEVENARLVMVNAQQAATIADQAAYIDVQNERLSELIDFMTQLMEKLQLSPFIHP